MGNNNDDSNFENISRKYSASELKSPRYFDNIDDVGLSEILWVPQVYTHITSNKYRKYSLSILQRIFLTLEDPSCCLIAKYLSYLDNIVVYFSVVATILSTLPHYQHYPKSCRDPVCDNTSLCPGEMLCPPEETATFVNIDLMCAIFFTIDLGIRSVLCGIMPTRLLGIISDDWDEKEKERAEIEGDEPRPEPKYTMFEQYIQYLVSFHSVVDLLSILPNYIELAINSSTNYRFTALRVLRLTRLLRVTYTNPKRKLIVSLINRTISESREVISILMFYVGIVIIFFATLVYICESGTYEISSDYPNGAFIRPNGYGGTVASPYTSIPVSIYFTIITMSTVGFGDIYPTTLAGRAVTCTCAIVSIMVTAMPITIFCSNFTREYEIYTQQIKRLKQRTSHRKRAMRQALATHMSKPITLPNALFTRPPLKRSKQRPVRQNLDIEASSENKINENVNLSTPPPECSPRKICDLANELLKAESNKDIVSTVNFDLYDVYDVEKGSKNTRGNILPKLSLPRLMSHDILPYPQTPKSVLKHDDESESNKSFKSSIFSKSFLQLVGTKDVVEVGIVLDDEIDEDDRVVNSKFIESILNLPEKDIYEMPAEQLAELFFDLRWAYRQLDKNIKNGLEVFTKTFGATPKKQTRSFF